MSDPDDLEDLTLLELQRERLRSAREREARLTLIANSARWTNILLAAHAGIGVLQDPPAVEPALAALALVLTAFLPGGLWRR